MPRLAYVNGRYGPLADAGVHVEDRGFQFADGVYEYWSVIEGRLADADGHLDRLERSLSELRIRAPMSRKALLRVLHETVRRNRVREGSVYLQVTRGAARRDHPFPKAEVAPSVVAIARPADFAAINARAAAGVGVLTQPDIRWGRCDIKTVGLLPNVLAKQAAREAGAFEAWLVDAEGHVTEGASTNAWIIDEQGRLRTRDLSANILRGITRKTLIDLAGELQMTVTEAPFTVEEAKRAKEAFFTAASAFITPVTSIDGVIIGNGRPGPISLRLRDLYFDHARRTAI
jgi:D-alanine transaminase